MLKQKIAAVLGIGALAGVFMLALPFTATAAESGAGMTQEQKDKQTIQRLEGQEKQESTAQYLDDTAMTAKVKSKILAQKGLDSLDIKVVTVNGDVTLIGDVENSAQIGLAESVTKDVEGVKRVNNELVLKK